MHICSACGYSVYPEDKYCGHCGHKLVANDKPNHMTQSSLRVEDVRSNLGMVYYKMGKAEKAIEEFEKVLKSNPENEKIRQLLEELKSKRT